MGGRKSVSAQQLWFRVLESQMETGTPYMLYKDHANRKSNQQNLGTIHCSNLCTEIMEYTSSEEIAVCNLASIALPAFVRQDGKDYDFEGLYNVTKVATRNLNKVIDKSYYPVEEARRSNMKHRPVGLGVQGLADTFLMMRLPFESEGARKLNKDIFETIYFAALEMSCDLAVLEGRYESFEGSPASRGQLQFDMWNVTPGSGRWDWVALKARKVKHGLRNSLLVAPMPTASTAQILGNNESFEPYTQNLYVRRTLSGEFVQVNRHLMKDLVERKLWTEDLRMQLIAHNGSVQSLDIPAELRELYKTVWESNNVSFSTWQPIGGPTLISHSRSTSLWLMRQLPSFHPCTSMVGNLDSRQACITFVQRLQRMQSSSRLKLTRSERQAQQMERTLQISRM